MRAYIEAHGCALNRGEAIELESMMRSAGWDLVDDPEKADLNVIATCAVIETTEKKMMKRVKSINSIGKPLIITGCMASALKSKMEPIAPSAVFVRPDGVEELCDIVGIAEEGDWTPEPIPNTFSHIIPIASGCTGECSYCLTRNARGDLNSRLSEKIIGAISRIDFSRGIKEIQLAAQDTGSYGMDIDTSLPNLLNELTASDYDMKIRVGMMNPRSVLSILDELIDAYSSPKIFKFLHLPLQSASDRILSDMERGYRLNDFELIVVKFRDAYPRLTLSTDLIVGYPEETKEDHLANVEFLERVKPDIVNITRFSPRPGTKAANGKNRVPGWIVKTRSRELTKLRFKISNTKNSEKIGRIVETVVTERGTNNSMIARTDNYEQVILPPSVDLGQRIRAKITDSTQIHLIGYPK